MIILMMAVAQRPTLIRCHGVAVPLAVPCVQPADRHGSGFKLQQLRSSCPCFLTLPRFSQLLQLHGRHVLLLHVNGRTETGWRAAGWAHPGIVIVSSGHLPVTVRRRSGAPKPSEWTEHRA